MTSRRSRISTRSCPASATATKPRHPGWRARRRRSDLWKMRRDPRQPHGRPGNESCRIKDAIGLCATLRRRACPGHPRRAVATNFRSWRLPVGVDARDKPGHDVLGLQKAECRSRILFPRSPPATGAGVALSSHAASLQGTIGGARKSAGIFPETRRAYSLPARSPVDSGDVTLAVYRRRASACHMNGSNGMA
jgi:hypothetical protein